jgi:hypothetical protein
MSYQSQMMIAMGRATSTLQTEFVSFFEVFYVFIIGSIVALIVRFGCK